MKKAIIEKIIDLRYGCAVLESRGFYDDTKEMGKELSELYKKYPEEYEEAEKEIYRTL